MNKTFIGIIIAAVVLVAAAVFFSGPPVTNPEPRGETIVCFGDSLTFGTGAKSEDMSYPAQLGRLIDEPVINSGVPGDTTAAASRRLDQDVLAHNPRIVLITLGGNDLMGGVEAEQAMATLESMVLKIQDRGALVVVGGIDAPVYGRGYHDAYVELRERTGCVLIDNVLDDIMGKNNLMADRIHPNAAGYAIMADHFYRAVKPYL